ncbi:MAG TPA: NAD(P)/FAD-dependent oxidoreductase [Pseudonocardiaceae bacterium]|nr:NAD(P)/FAD-dependent oxidoreductase [Pseudonocardiaceae bacterium]
MTSGGTTAWDAVVVGGGHNGLVAANYLARAGRSVLILERGGQLGGAAVSFRAFSGVDVRLSRYSYLVSLLPKQIIDELNLPIRLRKRAISSYTPVPGTEHGLLVDTANPDRTRASFRAVTGNDTDFPAWQRFYARTQRLAERVFPTLTEPLRGKDELRALVDDDLAWQGLFERPVGELLTAEFADDTVRGVVLTDALIGTFATAEDPTLKQNRCLLYHLIGNETGDWDVPIGGMGAVTGALIDAARAAGVQSRTGATVTAIDPDGLVRYTSDGTEYTVAARHVLANVAPNTLAALLGQTPADSPEGAQLKVNMVLRRLPRLRETGLDPTDAFGGTFHINESYKQLAAAHDQAQAGLLPSLPPCESYCHSLTDPSILGTAETTAGMQTLTVFGLHMPARLFQADNDKARTEALAATIASINSVLAEPIEDCLALDADGQPCIEAKTPLDLAAELGLPQGHIFHQDLSWPYARSSEQIGRWGVETEHERVLLCGAGAVRGGGVSGIPGHNAAKAVLAAARD